MSGDDSTMATPAGSPQQGLLELSDTVRLHHGGTLPGARIAWHLAGPADAPVVLALGGISAHRVVCSSGETCGWWDSLVGPGRALDSSRYRILGVDFLGGSGASTGPRDDGALDFPSVSTRDQADMILRVMDHLDIAALHAIVGASYGGMVALAFAEKHPHRVERLLVISASDRTHPMSTAWRSVQRRILRYALKHGEGAEGVKLARALAMATYRSSAEFERRFRGSPTREQGAFVFPVEQYLFARGSDYAGKYCASAFVCLSESIDLHSVDATRISTPLVLVGVAEDQLVPIADARALCGRLQGRAKLIEISSLYGHDAFLKEAALLTPIFRSLLETPIHDFVQDQRQHRRS